MYHSSLHNALEVRRFSIRQRDTGWEVLEETQGQIVKRVILSDWHRVERALAAIKDLEANLQQRGWQKTA